MKVIKTDNFDRQSFSDTLVQDGLSKAEADALAIELNKGLDGSSPHFHLAVADDYTLYVYGEDF